MSARRLRLLATAALTCALLVPQLASAGGAPRRPRQTDCGPSDVPIGVPIDTLGSGGAITIGGTEYGASADRERIAYLILDRTTRQPVRVEDPVTHKDVMLAGSVPGDSSGITTLEDLAGTYGNGEHFPGYLMIISGRVAPPPGLSGRFFPLLKKLGAPPVTLEQEQRFYARQPFSIIGIPGAVAGAATLRIPGRLDPPLSGSISGFLQRNLATKLDGCHVYDYVSPEYPEFDTGAESSATKNVMTVDGTRYEADLSGVPGATAGFHVLFLDSLSLRPVINRALVTNSTDPGHPDRTLQADAAAQLKRWLNYPSGRVGPLQPDVTVFIQTIGKPKAAGPQWNDIDDQFARLGANTLYVNALDGTQEYAFVGRLGSSAQPAEASTAFDHGAGTRPPKVAPARIQGVLGRSRQSTFEPLLDATPTAINPIAGVYASVLKVAYQPPERWPKLAPEEPDRAKAAAAETYVCEQLGFCGKAQGSCPTLRVCYWQEPLSGWSAYSAKAKDMAYPPHRDCEVPRPGADCFSEKTFDAVKTELAAEMNDLDIVQKWLDGLQKPFPETVSKGLFDISKISHDIQEATKVELPGNATASTLELISKLLAVGKLAGPEASAGAGGLSAVFGLAAYLSDEDGQPLTGGDITAAASQLGDQLFARFAAAQAEIGALRRLLFSDYGKLTEAARQIAGPWALPEPTDTANDLTAALKQWFYEALVPVGYPYLIRAYASNARALRCTSGSQSRWPNQPDQAQMLATVGYYNNGAPAKAIFFFTRGILGASSPPGSLADKLFPPLAQGGVDIDKLSFFTPRVFTRGILHAVDGANECSLGWLPAYQ